MAKEGSESKPLGSYPESGISVLIVGTGLAGLTAAIESVRKGHKVQVLERDSAINTAGELLYTNQMMEFHFNDRPGDMYFMGLSATPFFKHWPEMKEEYDSIGLHNAWIETYKHSGEQMIKPLKVAERLKAAGLDPNTPPGTFQMRPLIYRMFVRQVERLGVKIDFNSHVVDYWEDESKNKAGVTCKDGKVYEADVVIGGQVRAKSSGRAMWRAAFPIENMDKNPEVKEHYSMVGENKDEPMVRTYLAPGAYALTLTRPDTMIWILNHDVSRFHVSYTEYIH
jgi:flavin-dependent dehydrogenase